MSADTAHPSPEPSGDDHPGGIRGLIRDLLQFERGALAILVMVPLAMTLLDYYGMPWHWPEQRGRRPMHAYGEMRPTPAPLAHLVADMPLPGPEPVRHYVWWGVCCLVFLVGLPMLVAWLFAKERLELRAVRIIDDEGARLRVEAFPQDANVEGDVTPAGYEGSE